MISPEILIEIAKGESEVFKMAQEMIGPGEVALLLAQAAVAGTTMPLSPTKVSKVLEMSVEGAREKTEGSGCPAAYQRERAVTTFEMLAQVASGRGEAWEIARNLIGPAELGLLLAKAALSNTSHSISPTNAKDVLNMSESGARKKIENTAVRD
jgi:hypothetical protein